MNNPIKIEDLLLFLEGKLLENKKSRVEDFLLSDIDNFAVLKGLKDLKVQFEDNNALIIYLEKTKSQLKQKIYEYNEKNKN